MNPNLWLVLLLLPTAIPFHVKLSGKWNLRFPILYKLKDKRIGNTYDVGQRLFIILWFLTAVILLGIRGDFAADYKTYINMFYRCNKESFVDFCSMYSVTTIFTNFIEFGYGFLNFLCSRVSSNPVLMFTVVALITLFPIYKVVTKSEIPWMSLVLYLAIGYYFQAANTVRGFLAASIVIFSYKYVIERRFWKYCIVILFAALFHSTAMLMLPVYILLIQKPNKKLTIAIICTMAVALFFLEDLVILLASVLKLSAESGDALALLYRRQTSIVAILFPVGCIFLNIILFHIAEKNHYISNKDSYIGMLYYGCLMWSILTLLMMVSSYFIRFAAYFGYYIILALPLLISKIKDVKNKRILKVSILALGIIWSVILILKTEYYFVWQ